MNTKTPKPEYPCTDCIKEKRCTQYDSCAKWLRWYEASWRKIRKTFAKKSEKEKQSEIN